eukprot:760319-Hanusia_phi.AAC.2
MGRMPITRRHKQCQNDTRTPTPGRDQTITTVWNTGLTAISACIARAISENYSKGEDGGGMTRDLIQHKGSPRQL